MYAHKEAIMKRNSIYKKALVLAAVLALALILLVGCGQTTSGDSNLNQFVKPDTGSQQQTETVKTALSGNAARQLLLTSIINAKTIEPNSRYITFSFAPYVYVEKEGKTDKYTVSVKGSIDTLGGREDKQYPVNESVMSFEIIKGEVDQQALINNEVVEKNVVLGIYAKGGDMYIDFNDYATGKAVHRYYVSDSDIAYVVGLFKDILNQLKIEEVLTDYDLGSLINDAGVKNLISTILGTKSDDKLTLFNIMLSLISESGSYSVTNADGSVDLVMPTKLNAIFTNKTLLEQVGNVVNGLLGKQSDIIKGVVNFLVGDILSGKKTLNTAFVANISNNRFQKLALNVVSTKGGVDKTMELGVGGLSKSADFANEVKNSMPELVKADRKNYSFTTLSADLNVNLDIAKQEYSIENIDGAVGGAIAKALEGITGTEIYKKSDAIQILEPLQISLHLKLRAEINLKDNKKTRAVIELNGKDKKGNDRTYLGLYYIGADNALYADMSGLGGGKAMIPNINLNQILKDLIAAKIPEIPSIMEIIGGKGSGAASGDVINAGLIEAVQTAMDNGELVVTHYGLAAGDEDSAAVEETASLDIMALIGCLNIVKGDSTPLTVESISASLTKDVIAGLMGTLGMKLPIDQLDLKIYQTREDYEAGEEGWKIDVAVNMATEERGQILGANVGLFLNYGNPDPSLDGYLKGKEFKSAEQGGEYINAGKLTYKDGEFDFDLWVSIGLELELEFNVRENSVLDLSALGKLLYNLALKVQSPDGVNAKFNLKINANANVMALVNAIKNGADVAKILGAVDARIDITTGEGQNAKTAVLLLEDGMLYLNSSDGEFRNYKINILEALGGNFKLFGKDVSGTGSALASGEGDTTEGEGGDAPATEEKAKFDIVGLLLANINCFSVNRDRLEVAIADTLITALLNGLGVDTEIVKELNFSNNGTAISLEYDGLNLSKLWLKANVGIQQGDNAALGLGLGLGHIVLTVGQRNLAALGERNILEDEYQDLLNGGNVYLGLGAEIDVALDDETYVLEDLLGALVANFALGTTIDIKDEIKGGLTFNIVADIDISSKPDQNDSRILIEIRKKSNGKVFLGLYYDQKTTTLYLKTDDGTIIQPVALKFDLIRLLEGLINKGDGTASADIDLSELNPVILLGNKGLQIKVMTGVMKLLVGVLVGDMNDYIEYNAGATSYKYYAYDANTDYTILQNAYPLANPVGQKDLYQRNVDKYVYENGEFTLNNDYVGNDFFVKAKEGSFFYVLKDNATGIDEKYFEKNADGTLKEFANSGRKFTLIDATNKDIYASAPKYYQSVFKRADTLMFDMDKDVMEFTKGFIPAYNKTSGLTTYVKVDASRQEVALYEVFTKGSTMKDVFDKDGKPTGKTTEMKLKLPELGASIVIGQIEDGDVSVVEGGTKFSGIGIGIFIMRQGATEPFSFVKIAADETYTGTRYNLVDGSYVEAVDGEYKKVSNTAANVAIKLGNIQLSEKTFKESYGTSLEQFIDGLKNENLPQADATNIADLTVHVNVEAGIEIGAIKTAAGGDTWAIGGLLSGIVKGNEKVPSALANFLKSLLIKFNVQDKFKDVIGLRIAGNVNLGALLNSNTKDTMKIVKALLEKSDLAVELTDDYPWAATKKTVVGIYVTEGTIYININGDKTIKDTKLKIGVDKVLGMVGGASTGALASADVKGVDGILSIVNNIVKEISIYRNDEASGMTISLSKNMLGAILKLVADIDGVDLKLNETNSFIELNTKVTDKKPYLLKLGVGIDPLVLGIALGGLKIGLVGLDANNDVLKNLNKADYKGLSEIETMALDVEIGVDLGLKQGEFPIGKLVSGILQATGTDLEFPLNLDIQSELDLDLRVRLAGNLNLKDFGKSDIMLQVRNAATGKEKTILGLYFTTEKDATGKETPCLYVETQFFSQSAPVRSKVENFDLLGSLLGKTVSGVVEYLGGKVEGTGAALASDDGATTNEAEILLELASKSIQVKIAEETVKGLLEALVGDKVGDDIIEIINGLGLSAEVAVNLKDENKPLLSVVATCSYLDLGILVNKVNLSTQKQDIFGTTITGNAWTKTEDATKSALGVQFGVELNYDISNGKHSLDAILSNVASAAAFEKDATMATVGSILKALTADAIIKNTHGSIGIDVVLNVKSEKMTKYLVPAGQALYELIMGKIGAEYTAGKEKYDPLELLNMVEALIKINLNGNPVFVSLKDGYVYVSLSAVGGDNFKASLKNIIDQIKKTSGSGSSALATGEGDGEKDNKKTDYVLVNKILQNLLASASISDTGLDLALAPDLMNVLLENVVAKLLGDTFGFNDDVKAMFTLSSPYAKLSDGKTSVDDVLYTEKVEERYVRYNAAFESQQGSEQYFFDAEAKVYRKLYKADAVDATKYVVYTGGEVQTLYYLLGAGEYVALTAEQAAAARFVKYTHTSYLAVYDSADKATRNVVKAAGFVAGTTVYDANGNAVAEDKLFVKVKHSGIGWTKENGISIDLVFDNPNTTKAPDFSIGLGLDATLVLQGEAIEVIPYFVKKAGATALDNQEVKGYFKEGAALVEIPASEVYTGTRYDKDGNVDENGKFRKELVPGTETDHDLVLIGNTFPEVSETVGDEKIYLSMELGLTLSGTKGTNDSILDFVADIIDVSNRTSTTMKYVEFAEGEDKATYEGQRYSKTGAMAYAQDVNGTFKRGAYYLAEKEFVGTKFVKNTDGTFTVADNGAYKFVADDSAKTYFPILPEEAETYPADKKYREDGNGFVTDANGDFKAGEYSVTDRTKGGAKFRLNAATGKYFVYEATGITLYKQGNYYEIDKDELATFKGVRFDFDTVNKVATVNENGKYQFVAEEGAYYPVLENDGYTGKLYRVSEASTTDNTIYIEDVIYKFTPAFTGKDLRDLNALAKLLVSIGEFEAEARVKVTVGANVAELVKALSNTANIDIAELLKHVELAIESLDSKGTVKGGIYLYNSTLYIKYINTSRGIFSMPVSELFGAIGSASADERMPYEAAMLQLWVGEFIKLNGVYTTGIAVQATTSLVETLLETLLGFDKGTISLKAFGAVGVEVTIVTASPVFPENADGEVYVKKAYDFVALADGEVYDGEKYVLLANGEYGEIAKGSEAQFAGKTLYKRVAKAEADVSYVKLSEAGILSDCEGYDSAYAEALTTRYTKVTKTDGTEIFEELKFGFDFNSFGIGIGLKIGHVGFNLNIGKIDIGLIDGAKSIVPFEVQNEGIEYKVDTSGTLKFVADPEAATYFPIVANEVYEGDKYARRENGEFYKDENGTFKRGAYKTIAKDEDYTGTRFVKNVIAKETVIDLSMEVNLGLEFMDKENKYSTTGFDLGKFVDKLGVLTGVTLGENWLKLTVPEGGAEVRLSLRVALALNLTNVDHSVAAIEIVGQIFEGNKKIGEKTLIGVYYKEGNVLLNLAGLGFDNIRISGLRLSDLLGGSNGVEILKKLLGGSGSSSALASEVNFTVVGNDEFGSPAAALILDSNRIAVEVGTLFIQKLLGIAALGLDENTQKLLGGLDLKALVEVNFGEKFVEIPAGETFSGTKYAYDNETKKYYIDENGTFKRESNISLKLNAEAAELLGINVAVENIKIGNTGVEERVKAIDINDYVEFIEILFGTEKDENGNEIVDANGKPKKKIVGFEPKLEALTLSLDLDLGAMFTNGMAMGRSILDSEGKMVLTNVSSVGAIGNGNMGIRASVKLEIAFAALLNKLQQGFDSSDIFAAIEQALPLIKAQISIYAQSDGDELIGIYIADGNVYLMLDGLGMPNIKVTGEFLMDIIRTAMGSGTALSSDEATASVETSQIIGIVQKIVEGISVGGKALKVAFQNDYFANLIDAVLSIVLNKNIDYYNKVMPEVPTDVAFSGLTINLAGIENTYEQIYRKDGKYYFDAGCTSQYYGMVFFKNTVTNHIEMFSEKEYVKQFGAVDETTMFYRSTRNGLVELDLVAYSTHLKLAVNMPKIGAKKDIVSSPEVAGVAFTEADEVTGVALGLKGQVKIDKQPGIALANILSGVVGDLETKLVIEEDIDIRFAIEAAVGIKYSLKDKNFALNAVDLRISLTRVDKTLGIVPLAVLTYVSSEGTLYVDVSHFFQKQNAGNNKNLGMLKITGVNVLDLINGLLTGEGSATSVALGSSDAWVEDEQQPYTYVYYEANAINSAAPAKFVHVAQLNDKDELRMVYRNYTGTIVDYKTESGKDLYVRDRANKVTGYTLLSAENAEKFSHKAKYTHEQATTYTKLTDLYVKVGEDYVLAAGDADVTATALYKRVIGNYVKITDGETVNAEDKYEQNADGTYTQNANGTFKAVYKFVEVASGSKWYIEEYNSETCKYEYNVYDPAKESHNAPKLYHYDETEKKYVEGAGVGGAKSYVKVPVYSISAVWADLRNYGIADNVAGYDVASNAKVNITGKAMLGLIGGLMDKAGLEDILDALLVSVHATKDPFIFGADIGILDVYNDHKLALNVGLNIFGFDFEKREGAGNTDGSYLEFLDAENTISFRPANANNYRQFADVDLNRILSASEIMDVLVDSLDFGKSGKIYLNLSLDADSFAKDTGDNFVPWEKYFAALLGLNQNSARVLYQVLFPESELDGNGNFSIDIAAAIDVKKLLGGLIAGTGLNLEGTEIRITINSDTMLFSEDSRKDGSKIVITAIGEADGILSVFIDNSGYRGKGKHVARLDLNAILGTATSSAAYASANENTGLIPENIFGVMNALLGEVRLGGGKISIVLRENFIGALLNTLVGTDITEQQSLVKGEIYIDLRNLEVGIEMILGDDDYRTEVDRDFYIGLRIGGINLTAPDGFDMTEYTFIKKAERANFKNIKQLKLDINFESEWYYEATNKTDGFDISPVVDILETILKKKLFPDRLLQVLVKDDKIDAVYATAISAHIDLADFNKMKLSVEIFKSTSEEPERELKLGVYLDGQSVYVDLSGWGLPKIKLGGLNLGNTINDALLPLLNQYLVGDDNKRGGETAALASSYIENYDKNNPVEAEDGKYVLIYTVSSSGAYVLVDGNYVKYNAKEHAGATRYARSVVEYDATKHAGMKRYNATTGAFRASWGKVLFPVAYEEDENGGYVLIDGKYVSYNASLHEGQKRYKEVSGNKPYVSLLLANNRFGFGINADLINSLLETILSALNLDIQLPDFGDAVLLFDSRKDLNGDGYADTQLDLAVQVNDNLYFGFRTTNLEITGNSTKVSHAETRYAEVVGDGKEFVTVYDIEKGEIGLETVALGFNVQIRQNCVDSGQSDFEKYLGVLLKSLLGINNFTLNLPSSGEIGCDIDLRVSLNLANLVKALQGGNVDWWSDIELFLDLKPMNYGSLLTMYKQKGDADVYADLSGLSLFKVKVIGLQSLIGGLVSASATALASGDDTATKVPAPVGEKAILTVIPGKTGFKIEIGWGFIEGLLTSLLGDKLHFGEGGQCSDLYVRTIAGYNDTEVNITYDECNPFGMILGDFGDKDKLTENIPNAVSNSTISAFNELSKLFANSLAKFGIPADGNVYNRVVAETDKEAWEQYTAFYNKAMGIYDSAFAKIARNLNKSAIVGIKDIIEEDGTLIRTPYTIGFGENIEGVDYQEVIARLFGFKSAVAFKNAIINLKSLYEDYMKNPVNKALENGCVNTAYQIEEFSGKSFVFPIVVKNEITTPILTYVIIDNNGSASVWVSDIGEAMKATNFNAEHTTGSTVNNRLFGKYALFVTGMNLVGYKTITIGEGATATVIPLPKMNNDRALSLSINHPSAMYNRSLEIDLKLGFNKSDESSVNLKIHNFVLTSGQEKSGRYIRFGATKGKINEAGTGNGKLDAINGTNANAFSGLVLSDAKGISLVNILTSVIKGIDPDISISWKKNTNHYYTNSKTESYNTKQSATIELSRTTKSSEHMTGGVKTYAGKFQAYINNDQNREIGAWLFNNQLYIDITRTLDVTLAIGPLRKMKVADLDILGLLGGLGSASATNAMASDDATTEKSLKDTVSGFVKGIQVNWWNNQTVVGTVGDKAITTIRVDLNGKGLNNILAKLYYLLYGMYNTSAPAAELFSEEALYKMVYTEGEDVTLKDGTVVKSVNAHGKCVFYLQTFAANMIGSSVNKAIGDALKPGTAVTGKILREILGRLLPLPKLDEAENGRPSYVEIVIDKSRLASGKGVLKQIALVINKERTEIKDGTITEVGNKDDTAEIVINLDNNVTLRSVSAVRDYNTNSTKPNEDSGKTINVANPFDPVELTTAALKSAGLLDRVAADFYGISEYDSKSEKGQNDSYAELGGTPIVWDTSTAKLIPGEESEIWGYALNYKVQKVKVKVSNSTGFLRLFGYFKADGTTFVETNKITVDPTKDPTGTDNISAGLPRIIVIMRRDGELQVLSRDYDKDKPGTVNINGTDYTVDGKFNWIDEDTVEEGATVEKLFWYQVGYSSRIQKSIKVKYNNVDIVSGSLPNDDKFGILNGGTAFDFTPANFDIVGNLGLPSIKASETFTKNGDKFSYVGFDGSTYEFTPGTAPTDETELAEWNKHTLGGNGTFTRSFNGKVLQNGTYVYVAAESTAAGLLDSLGGLFGGSGANTDNGKYALTVTDTGYTGLKEITVKLGTGKTTTVDVIEWNYDDFKYDMRKPQNGASGRIVAVINKYEIKRTTGLVEKTEVVNSKQKIRLDVGITQESLSALAGGDLKFNQYEDAFVLSATGDYVLETRDAFIPYDETLHKDKKQYALVEGKYVDASKAAADNTARYVEGKVTGYVYDKYVKGVSTADNRYAINIFDAEELYVKVKHSRITSETQQFHVDNFKFYTDTFAATDTAQTPFTMFVVPELGVKTERNITVKALYDVNGAYEQIFDIKVVVTPKVATKVVLLIDNDQEINETYLESTAEVTVYYKDGTEKQGLAKDLIRLTDSEIEKIANAKDHLGITYGTASVFKKGRYELIAAGETYDGQRFNLVDGNFVEATDGAYKFVEDETFVQNGVTFEIRVFSKN